MKRGRVATELELELKNAPSPDAIPVQYEVKVEESTVSVGAPLQLGEFLKRCHYCRKLLAANEAVFMYRDFGSFCSTKCREIQMNLDNEKQKQVSSSKQNADQRKGSDWKRQNVTKQKQ